MRMLAGAIAVFGLTGCATTGATLNSGVGDSFPSHPPYYAGAGAPGAKLVRVPIRYAGGESIFDPLNKPGSPVARLLDEMNRFLDSLSTTRGMTRLDRIAIGTEPNVYFGCRRDTGSDCTESDEKSITWKTAGMHLALHRPSADWIAAMQAMLDGAGATHALVLTLETSEFWTAQKGLLGSKSVELGTGNAMGVPWLTSLDTPVSVLQLTGAVIGRDGRGVKIGAEGFLGRRTPFLMSAVGTQRTISDDDIEQVRKLRRDDLPGKPLAWQVALCQLVAGLTSEKPAC